MLIALAVTGCGGSSDSGTQVSVEETPSKAEFIQRADRICEEVDETQKAAFRNYIARHPNTIENQSVNEELVTTIGLPPLGAEVRQLDALPVPAGDEKQIQAIIEELDKVVEEAEKNPDLLVNLGNSAGPFATAGKLAREYGLKACAFPL